MQLDLVNILVTPQVLVIAAAIVAVLHFAGRIPVKGGALGKRRAWRRILPVLPVVLGIGAAFLPGVLTAEDGSVPAWGTRLLIGAWAGLVAAQGRKVLKRAFVDKIEKDGAA